MAGRRGRELDQRSLLWHNVGFLAGYPVTRADDYQQWTLLAYAPIDALAATLDEITKEKQRIAGALARAGAHREKLTGQLSELEAAERVLARYSKATPARKTGSAKTPTTATKAAAVPRPRRSRTRAEEPAGDKRTFLAIRCLLWQMAGRTQPEIAAACKGARPNHVGAAIARYKRAGRIEERDGKLYAS